MTFKATSFLALNASLSGVEQDFPEIGDTLPMHSHDESSIHLTFIKRGAIRAHGPWGEKVLRQGDLVEWRANEPHEFVAIEPGTRAVQISCAKPVTIEAIGQGGGTSYFGRTRGRD